MYRHTYRLIYPSAFIAGKLGLEEPGGCSKTFKYSYQGSCGWGVGGWRELMPTKACRTPVAYSRPYYPTDSTTHPRSQPHPYT